MRSRHFMFAMATLVAVVIFAACATHSAKRRAESMSCGNYMCSIVIGARAWAMDTDWASFTLDNSSYEIVTPRLRDGDSNGVFLRCKFHHNHRGYADGTVFDGIKRRTKVR